MTEILEKRCFYNMSNNFIKESIESYISIYHLRHKRTQGTFSEVNYGFK